MTTVDSFLHNALVELEWLLVILSNDIKAKLPLALASPPRSRKTEDSEKDRLPHPSCCTID